MEVLKKLSTKHKKIILLVLTVVVLSTIIVIGIIGENASERQNDGKINMPSVSERFEGEPYKEVISDLEAAGFTNVKTTVIDDLITGWMTKEGEVESVSVDGDKDYSTDVWYHNDIEVMVTYHTFKEKKESEPDKQGSSEVVTSESSTSESGEEKVSSINDTPKIPLENDYEKSVWQTIKDNGGELTDISLDKAEDIGETLSSYYIEFKCANSYSIVNPIVESIKAVAQKNKIDIKTRIVVNGLDGNNLTLFEVLADGTISKVSQTSIYKDERYDWFNGLFSAWDGSNSTVNKLIKQSLNDEKSFEHIETTSIDVNTEAKKTDVIKILAQANVEVSIQVGDVIIITEFSAKNAFDATVKKTAYSLASFTSKEIVLLTVI